MQLLIIFSIPLWINCLLIQPPKVSKRVSHSPRWCPQIASFVWPTDRNPKRWHLQENNDGSTSTHLRSSRQLFAWQNESTEFCRWSEVFQINSIWRFKSMLMIAYSNDHRLTIWFSDLFLRITMRGWCLDGSASWYNWLSDIWTLRFELYLANKSR